MRVVAPLLAALSCAAASDWNQNAPWNAPPPAPPQGGYAQDPYFQQYPAPGGDYSDAHARPREDRSPQKTLEERYLSTLSGRALARASGAACSGCTGLFLAKAITGVVRPTWGIAGTGGALAACLVNGRGAEFCLALGLTANAALDRSRSLNGQYPIFKQLKSALHLAPRRNFPPDVEDPWQYDPAQASMTNDGKPPPQFSMSLALGAMLALGGFGSSLIPLPPLFPSSIFGLLAAGGLAWTATLRNARGDAARCVAARLIALVRIIMSCASEARLFGKASAAVRLSALHLGAFDQKFGVSKGLMSLFNKVLASTAGAQAAGSQGQQQQQQQRPRPPQGAYGAQGQQQQQQRPRADAPGLDDWGRPTGPPQGRPGPPGYGPQGYPPPGDGGYGQYPPR
ncbi:hypothetical protein M885DRAFT_505545 [Pelagophyceae sp. CCMP2097]|nr:hypothetical protein M885DRAFT_505545 [Pelagophyceae sp. CCMP2097]